MDVKVGACATYGAYVPQSTESVDIVESAVGDDCVNGMYYVTYAKEQNMDDGAKRADAVNVPEPADIAHGSSARSCDLYDQRERCQLCD